MSGRTAQLVWEDGGVVLVERTPLPGIVSMDMDMCGRWGEEVKTTVSVRGDHQQAIRSVEVLAKHLGHPVEVEDLEVRP